MGRPFGGGEHDPCQFERWFRDLITSKSPRGMLSRSCWQPAADVYETKEALVVRMEVPGLDPESVSIASSGDSLTIRGRRADRPPRGRTRLHQMEIRYGDFERAFSLSFPVRHDRARATYEDGFLTVEVPRRKRQEMLPTTYIKIRLY